MQGEVGGLQNVRGGVLQSNEFRRKILAQRERDVMAQPFEAATLDAQPPQVVMPPSAPFEPVQTPSQAT